MHSLQDTLVLPKHSKVLYEKVRERATMMEIGGGHSDIRSMAVIGKIIEKLDVSRLISEDRTKLAIELDEKCQTVRDKLTHYRNRTQFHSGSYSETAFRSALQELVNN